MKRAPLGIVMSGLIGAGAAAACASCASILSLQDGVTVSDDASSTGNVDSAAPDVSLSDEEPIFGEPDANSSGADASIPDGTTAADTGAARDGALDASGRGDAGPDAATDASDSAAPDTGIPCGSTLLIATAATASPMALQPANGAIDGLLTTRWESQWGVDPQWIYADFGQPVFIDRVEIVWETACAADYQLQVSDDPDAGSWTTMTTVTGNSLSDPMPTDYSNAVDTRSLVGVGRYMRVNGYIRCDTAYGYSIWEIRTYGDMNATCTP